MPLLLNLNLPFLSRMEYVYIMNYNIEELNEILLAARLTDAEKDNIKSSIIQFGILPKDADLFRRIKNVDASKTFARLCKWCCNNKVSCDIVTFSNEK